MSYSPFITITGIQPAANESAVEYVIQVGLPGYYYDPKHLCLCASNARALWKGIRVRNGHVARLMVNGQLTSTKTESGEVRRVVGDPFEVPAPAYSAGERRRLAA